VRLRDFFQQRVGVDAGGRLRVVPTPGWAVRAYPALEAATCLLLQLRRVPVAARCAVAYQSEERVLDLTARRALLLHLNREARGPRHEIHPETARFGPTGAVESQPCRRLSS